MSDVVLEFTNRSDAYGYVSESRRLATSLLWDITVRRAEHGWQVRIPEQVFAGGVADALDRFHGTVLVRDERRQV
jgi:hypothetical protein